MPEYICLQNIAGFEILPEERVNYQRADISDMASRAGLEMTETQGNVSADTLLKTATRPCGDIDWRCALRGDCLSIFFLTTLDRMPEFERLYRDILEKNGIRRNETGIYIQPVVQNHACHVELMTCFDPTDKKLVLKIMDIEKEAVNALAGRGAFFSRPYGTAGEFVFSQNQGNFELVKKVKDIFDPNHILNKGKWGL